MAFYLLTVQIQILFDVCTHSYNNENEENMLRS